MKVAPTALTVARAARLLRHAGRQTAGRSQIGHNGRAQASRCCPRKPRLCDSSAWGRLRQRRGAQDVTERLKAVRAPEQVLLQQRVVQCAKVRVHNGVIAQLRAEVLRTRECLTSKGCKHR